MMPVIEKMKEEFLPYIIEIENQSFPNPWNKELFLEELKSEKTVHFTVAVCGEVVGYSISFIVADELHLQKIAVSSENRKKGIGKLLMNDILEWALTNSCTKAWLEVRESNVSAIKFYKSLHFEQINIRKNYYSAENGNAIEMVLNIR